MSERRFRAALVLGAAAASLALTPAPADRATAAPAPAGTGKSVHISVNSITPSTPVGSNTHLPLTVELSLTNVTDLPIQNVRITAVRGDPIDSQAALDDAFRHASLPASPGRDIKPTRAVTVNLAPGAMRVAATFTTTTSILDDGSGICLCANGVYPLYFSAHVTGSAGTDERLGSTSTYLPSFFKKPTPVQVSWVWPLIDRPHRLVDDTVFTDDDLTNSVSTGRLSRALQVVESVGRDVPMTLVIDPELIDELQVMSTVPYTVPTGAARPVPGTGKAAATEWLSRLRTVLTDPKIQVDLTAYADPDVQSLTTEGLTWASILPIVMNTRVTQALAGLPQSDIAWPAAGAVSRRTLDALTAAGASTVILDSSSVTPSTVASGLPASLATLDTASGTVTAALSSSAIKKVIASTVSLGGAGAADLPALVAELAVRVAQAPGTAHTVLMTPPRYVDPSPESAERTIRVTSINPFSEPVALRAATGAGARPAQHSRLAKLPAGAAGLPDGIVGTASAVGAQIPAVSALLVKSPEAQPLVTALPLAVQRVESSAWRPDSNVGGPAVGLPRSKQLDAQVDTILAGVRIVTPSSGSANYTLASSNSPLPITVENTLDYAAEVTVQVTAVGGLPGFTARDLGQQRVAPHTKQTVRVPTRVERTGRIQVQAQLRTTDGTPLGKHVLLSVHSTVLGTVGVVITAVAGVILALALVLRLTRRLRKRRAFGSGPVPVRAPEAIS